MEILFWIWVLTWMFKTAATDVLHAAKGTPNPRYELKKQKAIAAGKPVTGQARYGTREWAADLYSDALVAHTERRRAKAAAPKPVDDMVDVAREPRLSPSSVVHDGTSTSRATAGKWAWSCRRLGCPGKGFDYDSEAAAKAGAAAHRCSDTDAMPGEGVQIVGPGQAGNQSTPEPAPAPTPEPTGEQPKLATVIPMFPTAKEIVMPNVNGEVTGLDPAISYTTALAQFAGEHGAAGNEGYIGFLTKSKVKGQGLQSAHDMQEAFANAQAAAKRHAEELGKQKTVQEAYDQNPDAGDKDMMLNGR
ncbi:hypothetical protein ABT023_16180 [Micromonospora sp. NPDC002296]|uniref:hypothetical protein n=1 Tax=Micromonospora sp. NPDC002296 TaxID=3154271 RepID=UPI00332B69F3